MKTLVAFVLAGYEKAVISARSILCALIINFSFYSMAYAMHVFVKERKTT